MGLIFSIVALLFMPFTWVKMFRYKRWPYYTIILSYLLSSISYFISEEYVPSTLFFISSILWFIILKIVNIRVKNMERIKRIKILMNSITLLKRCSDYNPVNTEEGLKIEPSKKLKEFRLK